MSSRTPFASLALLLAVAVTSVQAQPPERDRPRGDRPFRGERDGDRPERERGERERGERERGERERGERERRRGGGPEMAPEAMAKQLLERFDKDDDQKLDSQELVAALQALRQMRGPRGERGERGDRPRDGDDAPRRAPVE